MTVTLSDGGSPGDLSPLPLTYTPVGAGTYHGEQGEQVLAGVHLELGGHGPQQVVLAPQGRGLQHRLNVLTLQKKKTNRNLINFYQKKINNTSKKLF